MARCTNTCPLLFLDISHKKTNTKEKLKLQARATHGGMHQHLFALFQNIFINVYLGRRMIISRYIQIHLQKFCKKCSHRFFKELPFSADSPSPRYITTVSNTITITNTLTLLLQKWICSFHRASFQKLARTLDGGDACFQIFVKRNLEIYERREKPWSRLSWKVHNGNNLSVSGCPYQACLMWGVNSWNTDIDER